MWKPRAQGLAYNKIIYMWVIIITPWCIITLKKQTNSERTYSQPFWSFHWGLDWGCGWRLAGGSEGDFVPWLVTGQGRAVAGVRKLRGLILKELQISKFWIHSFTSGSSTNILILRVPQAGQGSCSQASGGMAPRVGEPQWPLCSLQPQVAEKAQRLKVIWNIPG